MARLRSSVWISRVVLGGEPWPVSVAANGTNTWTDADGAELPQPFFQAIGSPSAGTFTHHPSIAFEAAEGGQQQHRVGHPPSGSLRPGTGPGYPGMATRRSGRAAFKGGTIVRFAFLILIVMVAGCSPCQQWAQRESFCYGESTTGSVASDADVCEDVRSDLAESGRARYDCMIRCWAEAPSCQDHFFFYEDGGAWWDTCNDRCS